MDKVKNMNTTLEIPEGSKATIAGKNIDGKYYLVVEVENKSDMMADWDKAKAITLCPICGGKMDFKHVMNTGDSGTNKTTIFLEYMNEIYVDRDFYSRGKIIEMAKDKYVELHGNVNNDEELKDTIVSIIKQRIESEYRKHPDLGWAEIAARKICAEIINEKKQ